MGWKGGGVTKASCVPMCLAGYLGSLLQPASVSWPIVGPVLQGYVVWRLLQAIRNKSPGEGA